MKKIWIALLLVSCSNDPAETKKVAGKTQNDDIVNKGEKPVELGDFRFFMNEEKKLSKATISNLEYVAADHSLKFSLDYKACTKAGHT
ncbi:MAG: hypothetical protein EOP04_19755, partial [Proteobacteria bacterium]